MRVTSSMYYDSIYATNNSKLSKELFDVNKQIASGLKIQYAKDDVGIFSETMRLDNEVTILGQIKESTQSGYKVSNQSDVVLNEFSNILTRVKTLLIQGASSANNGVSLDAIATELRGVEKNLKTLANTSINGQYLFSGSSVDVKPISDDGTYNGNDVAMNAFLGTNNLQQYNLTGAELFLGEEALNSRKITTNVINRNLLSDFPALQASELDEESLLTPSSSIRNLMGDVDALSDTVDKHFFYIRGTSSDGTAFKDKVAMNDEQSVQELLDYIGDLYGNTPNLKVVNVSMNNSGQIVVEDKIKGSSKLDFHIVGAVDFSGGAAADVANIDALSGGETNFKEIANPTTPPANNLFVKEFVKSGLSVANSVTSNIEASVYDRVEFSKVGAKLSSNVSQIVKDNNAFASNTTKLSEVFSGPLDAKSLKLEGNTIAGAPYDVTVNLLDAGSTFTIGANTYNFFDVSGNSVPAENMTYKQMMDLVNVVVTGELPDGTYANNAASFHSKIKEATDSGETYLSYDGKIQFAQKGVTQTQASLALYDANSGDFTVGAAASVATFNANNALSITDPKTDLFKSLDLAIKAVEEYKEQPDASVGDARGVGIQNAIAMLDNMMSHVSRSQTIVGANSNALTRSLERTKLLEISTMTLRSSVVDTDLAESSLKLTQLSLNYEAMLSTVGRVSKLSLVNYL